MLKAVSIAKEYGYSQYKEQLSFIKLNYSNTIEGKEAEYILEEVLPLLSSKDFSANEISNNFKMIFFKRSFLRCFSSRVFFLGCMLL